MNKYSSYHETDCDWIGKIPSSWRLVRGRFLFRSKKEINRDMQCENLLSLTYDGVLNKNFSGFEGLRPENYNTYQIFQKDNLVFKMIDLENVKTSRVGIVHEKGIMSSAYIRFEAIKTKIEPKFAYWFYYDLYKKEIYNSIGSGVRSTLSSSDLLEMELPVPQLEEQKLISVYLDKKTDQIDQLIEKIEKKIEFLREQRISLINEYVTKGLDPNVEMKDSGVEWVGEIPKHWTTKKLPHVCFFQEGPGLRNWQFKVDGVRVVCVTNIKPSGLTFENYQRYISENEYDSSYKHFTVEDGDLLMASSGNSFGKICRYNGEFNKKFILNTSTIRLHSHDESVLSTNYLKIFIQSETFQRQIRFLITGAAQPNFGPTHLNRIYCLLPPIEEQQLIMKKNHDVIHNLERCLDKEENRVTLLKEYRQSLISSVVTGKVLVTENML